MRFVCLNWVIRGVLIDEFAYRVIVLYTMAATFSRLV